MIRARRCRSPDGIPAPEHGRNRQPRQNRPMVSGVPVEPIIDQPIAEPPWGWGNPPPKPEVPAPSGWQLKYGWTEATGWFVFAVPTGPVPTPSKKK